MSSASTTGPDAVTSISVFEDRAGAEESTRTAGKWLQDNDLAALVPNPPTVVQGEAMLSAP